MRRQCGEGKIDSNVRNADTLPLCKDGYTWNQPISCVGAVAYGRLLLTRAAPHA